MQSKILLKWLFFIVCVVGIVFISIIIFSAPNISSQTPQSLMRNVDAAVDPVGLTDVPKKTELAPAGIPIRLKIQAINVDAVVEPVGLTPDGAMDVPKNQDDLAWFEPGARPGEEGSSVIGGHYGRWKNGRGSVFDDLNKLSRGDKVYVEDDKGVMISFVVRESREYDPKGDASDVFNSDDGKSHLNLVTCKGTWDEATKSYPSRLVVFTDKE